MQKEMEQVDIAETVLIVILNLYNSNATKYLCFRFCWQLQVKGQLRKYVHAVQLLKDKHGRATTGGHLITYWN